MTGLIVYPGCGEGYEIPREQSGEEERKGEKEKVQKAQRYQGHEEGYGVPGRQNIGYQRCSV